MRKISLLIQFLLVTMMTQATENPFLSDYKTPFETIPFNEIKNEHYMPAFTQGMKEHSAEVLAIANSNEAPTFANTIEALERSGLLLSKVQYCFYNILHAETNDSLDNIAELVSPIETKHANDITLNEKLFARIKTIYDSREVLKLNAEQNMLLEKTYDSFVRSGAQLNAEEKKKYQEYSEQLNLAELKFGQNVLKETNKYLLVVTDVNDLDGLPADVLEAAASLAKKKEKQGWAFNLTYPSYVPFMKYAKNRKLRQELYIAYNTKAIDGENENQTVVKQIVSLRLQIAKLMGYKDYAAFALHRRMAENEQNVYKLLDQLLEAYKPKAQAELAEVQAYADAKGVDFQIMPWDWSFYSEKLKEEKYSVNDEQLKPYFELEQVKKGVFNLATKLYGLSFKKNTQIQVYHPEVEAFEVYGADQKFLAVLYTDFHPRDGKKSGAWMTEYKPQWKDEKGDSRPHISLVMNFSRATSTQPVLLTFDELTTFLHEFGHSLHGMLADGTYTSLSGTNVYRDFVELPSQLMENWAVEKEFLDGFAIHYKTGEPIPNELITKIKASENFNVGNQCLRQLSFAYLDMAWHTQKAPFAGDVLAFEKQAWTKTQILPLLESTNMSVQFNHIFSGGYAAGYYSYKWAEVLDADAYSVFKKNGIFDTETASSFRENVLSKGGSEHPMVLYKRFRGQEPTIDALLIRNGVK